MWCTVDDGSERIDKDGKTCVLREAPIKFISILNQLAFIASRAQVKAPETDKQESGQDCLVPVVTSIGEGYAGKL